MITVCVFLYSNILKSTPFKRCANNLELKVEARQGGKKQTETKDRIAKTSNSVDSKAHNEKTDDTEQQKCYRLGRWTGQVCVLRIARPCAFSAYLGKALEIVHYILHSNIIGQAPHNDDAGPRMCEVGLRRDRRARVPVDNRGEVGRALRQLRHGRREGCLQRLGYLRHLHRADGGGRVRRQLQRRRRHCGHRRRVASLDRDNSFMHTVKYETHNFKVCHDEIVFLMLLTINPMI